MIAKEMLLRLFNIRYSDERRSLPVDLRKIIGVARFSHSGFEEQPCEKERNGAWLLESAQSLVIY